MGVPALACLKCWDARCMQMAEQHRARLLQQQGKLTLVCPLEWIRSARCSARTSVTYVVLINILYSDELYAGPSGHGRGLSGAVESCGHRSGRSTRPKGSTRLRAGGA